MAVTATLVRPRGELQVLRATLMNAQNVGSTANSAWLDFSGVLQANIHAAGLTAGVLEVHASNVADEPAAATDGVVLNNTTANPGDIFILGPWRWIKLKATTSPTGTVTAILEGI